MQHKAFALSRGNGFDVFSVWEYQSNRWKEILVARPKRAIALYAENPHARLVFPVGFNPNVVGKETLTKKRKYERKKQQPPARSRQKNIKQTAKVAKNKKANISK